MIGPEAAEAVQARDGRTLAYAQIGDPDGTPAFRLARDPGVALSGLHPNPPQVADARLRVLTATSWLRALRPAARQ
jgi:hypothetical protein